ncbi:MAG: Potassium efflux system KefA protein / Small-conductance mechanosensitive channel [Polyangiaceae bacterium]|nr:Potassium efflux system KefA protein / Small-conductance mechanosensitive channel [Polyangiaceae bacterium]
MTKELIYVGVFAAVIVVLAAVFRVVPGASRRRLRRSVLLLALHLLVVLATSVLALSRFDEVALGFSLAGELLRVLLIINLSALAVFDLLAPLTRWDFPDILHDLVVGAAYLVAAGWLMHKAGVNLTSIIATSAVVTAVIGLSLQATLGNIVGGLALQVDESFKEGDWLEFENKQQAQVKKVRWRHTVLETRDNDTLIVPNGQLMAQSIKVLGRRDGKAVPHRQWVYFCVDFRFSPADVISVVNQALVSAPITGVVTDPAAHCICNDLARDNRDGYALYAVRYWLDDLWRNDATSSDVRERVYSALKRADIPLAIPAAALFLEQEDSVKAERKIQRDVESKLRTLDAIELFRTLETEERRSLAQTTRRTPFGRAEVITRQGAQANWLYVLAKGEVEVRVATPEGERRVAVLRAPSFFGEMALMTGQPREATVVALTAVECLRIDKADFQGILQRRPSIAERISEILAARRLELEAVRGVVDDDHARSNRLSHENLRILNGIRDFFGL